MVVLFAVKITLLLAAKRKWYAYCFYFVLAYGCNINTFRSCHKQPKMAGVSVPANFKGLQHYVKTAVEHDKRDPVVAYYCEYLIYHANESYLVGCYHLYTKLQSWFTVISTNLRTVAKELLWPVFRVHGKKCGLRKWSKTVPRRW